MTFVTSLLERVIEEQSHGEASAAQSVRQTITAEVGAALSDIRPGPRRRSG